MLSSLRWHATIGRRGRDKRKVDCEGDLLALGVLSYGQATSDSRTPGHIKESKEKGETCVLNLMELLKRLVVIWAKRTGSALISEPPSVLQPRYTVCQVRLVRWVEQNCKR